MYKINPGFELQTVCGETILMGMGEDNVDFTKVISLNETSLFIWKKLQEGINTVEAIAEAMTQEYEVSADVAAGDIQTLLNKLEEIKVIRTE